MKENTAYSTLGDFILKAFTKKFKDTTQQGDAIKYSTSRKNVSF